MISRHWRALAKPADADRYIEYLRKETLPHMADVPGLVSVTVHRRDVEKGVEILIITQWESIKPIQEFGDAPVVPQRTRDLMLEYDDKVRMYEVVETLERR
jgi:heme-degrading monooxygenase HmoA